MTRQSQQLIGPAITTLYEIDFSVASTLLGKRYLVAAKTTDNLIDVEFQGQAYEPILIEGSGFSESLEGAGARPTLLIGNLAQEVTALINDLGDYGLQGVPVLRRLVYLEEQELEREDLWTVESYQTTRSTGVLSLSSIMDQPNLATPRHVIGEVD